MGYDYPILDNEELDLVKVKMYPSWVKFDATPLSGSRAGRSLGLGSTLEGTCEGSLPVVGGGA